MEMRTILTHILHDFSFELVGSTKEAAEDPEKVAMMGVNRGTMGPRDWDTGHDDPRRAKLGLYIHARPRRK